MLAIRAASGLVQMKFWYCDAKTVLGLPMTVTPAPTEQHSTAVKQSSVAWIRALHSQDGTHGKSITMPVPMTPAFRSIGRGNFTPKPGCHDAMMHHA